MQQNTERILNIFFKLTREEADTLRAAGRSIKRHLCSLFVGVFKSAGHAVKSIKVTFNCTEVLKKSFQKIYSKLI